MVFFESELQFKFSKGNWQVKKYDTHRYYKILSGAGLKGVDFLGILNDSQVVFFEVKHFRTPSIIKSSSYSIFEDTNAFIQHIADKLEDSITAIRVIDNYLGRKWWFRLFLKWQKWIPNFIFRNRDWHFWFLVTQKIQQKENTIFVLWLEIDNEFSPVSREKIKQLIDQNLEVELSEYVAAVEIASKKYPVFKDVLKVK